MESGLSWCDVLSGSKVNGNRDRRQPRNHLGLFPKREDGKNQKEGGRGGILESMPLRSFCVVAMNSGTDELCLFGKRQEGIGKQQTNRPKAHQEKWQIGGGKR